MISFIPVSILAYALNGGSIILDKILLQKTTNTPIFYTFYINVLQILIVLLIPFLGFNWNFNQGSFFAVLSGAISVLAVFTFFKSLSLSEASVSGPIIGVLNPFFTIILGGLFLNQILTINQYLAVAILLLGSIILTLNNLVHKLKYFEIGLIWMISSGLLYALSYLFLREAFLKDTFINCLVLSRATAALLVLILLLFANFRKEIFVKNSSLKSTVKWMFILIVLSQLMGGLSSFLIILGVSLANPALINAFFGVQYIVILIAALFLYKRHSQLLDETITKVVVIQKILGVFLLSYGLYLLSK